VEPRGAEEGKKLVCPRQKGIFSGIRVVVRIIVSM
jgi:hypothetical protein